MNIFEKASRNKLRFTYRGIITTEDLWDLKVEILDDIYKALVADQEASTGASLLKKTSKESVIDLKIEIVKHIVAHKLEQRDAMIAAKANKERKEQLLNILADKENEELKGLTIAELKAKIDEL